MRLIGSINDKQHVERFIAYLITQNISAQVEQDDSRFSIWVRDEDRVAEAAGLLKSFTESPSDPRYAQAIATASEIIHERTRKQRDAQKRLRTAADIRVAPRYRSPLALFLFGLMIAVWLATGLGHQPFNDALCNMLFTSIDVRRAADLVAADDLNNLSAKLYNISHGEVWRLITPAFIHFGAAHMIFNLLAWLMLGRPIEHRYGTLYFALFVLFVALVSNFFQAAVPESLGGTSLGLAGNRLIMPFGGLSGVVYGLIGFAWIKSEFDPSFGFRVPLSLVIWAVAWFYLGVSNLDQQWLGFSMANWAHGVGFVSGIVIGLVTTYWKIGKSSGQRPDKRAK